MPRVSERTYIDVSNLVKLGAARAAVTSTFISDIKLNRKKEEALKLILELEDYYEKRVQR